MQYSILKQLFTLLSHLCHCKKLKAFLVNIMGIR